MFFKKKNQAAIGVNFPTDSRRLANHFDDEKGQQLRKGLSFCANAQRLVSALGVDDPFPSFDEWPQGRAEHDRQLRWPRVEVSVTVLVKFHLAVGELFKLGDAPMDRSFMRLQHILELRHAVWPATAQDFVQL